MRHEFELKGKAEALDTVISVFVNSFYQVHWEMRKSGNVKRKVLVIDEIKSKKQGEEQ